MSSRPLRIAFIHPDLGIGGAERLVVDAAVGMQKKGHQVILYTSHHDPNHCFEETRDGTLKVQVRGDWLPRTLFGRFYILCAILRQFILVASLILWKRNVYDVFFIDQLSACVPLLKWFTAAKILFYCHFPDKLLTQRNSTIKKLYRVPVDKMEELTTGMSHMIAVNSGFTAGMFKKSFPSIQQTPRVLYPPINFDAYDRPIDCNDPTVKILETDKRVLLSINRFERKKNVELALRAFAALERNNLVSKEVFSNYRLVLAGGYDKRVSENVEYLEELDQLATQEFGLKTFTIHPSTTSTVSVPPDAQVVFVCSFNDAQRTFLLDQAELLLYTPSNEHFGITPVEGMYASVPVIAVNTGGPVETVKDKETGLLLASDPELWAQGIRDFITQKYDGKEMGQHGRRHVQSKFSLPAFADQLEAMMMELTSELSASRANSALYLFGIIGVLFACIFIYIKQ